jgi:predicted metal-binding protein
MGGKTMAIPSMMDYGEITLPSKPANPPAFGKSDNEVMEDLNNLVKLAYELGADKAALIPSEKVVVDLRSLAKCMMPMCIQYGKNLMCPPHCITPEEATKLVNAYQYAILVRKEVTDKELEGFTGSDAYQHIYERMGDHMMTINTILARVEGEAFYLGYYYALGFGVGPCAQCGVEEIKKGKRKHLPDVLPCKGLDKGGCVFARAPLARPSTEAVGIDIYATATNAGWPIYAVGLRSDLNTIPCIGFHGLLLVW